MNILFICDGNVARSQAAELYFNKFNKNANDTAVSAGVNAIEGKPIAPTVLEVMAEDGVSMQGCYRKKLSELSLNGIGMVVSFKAKEDLPPYVAQSPDVRYWDVPDPRHESIEFHRQVRDAVKERVTQLVEELYGA